jgi:hypothetical protein
MDSATILRMRENAVKKIEIEVCEEALSSA